MRYSSALTLLPGGVAQLLPDTNANALQEDVVEHLEQQSSALAAPTHGLPGCTDTQTASLMNVIPRKRRRIAHLVEVGVVEVGAIGRPWRQWAVEVGIDAFVRRDDIGRHHTA